METAVNSLLDEIIQEILAKLNKQDLDPKLLSNFLAPYLAKVESSSRDTNTPRGNNQDTYNNNSTSKISLVEQIKQAYKELLKDQSYVNESKKFNEKTETDDEGDDASKENLKDKEGRKTLIDDKPKPQEIILAGFTERGSRVLKDTFGGFFKGFFDKLKGFFDKLQTPKGSFGLIGGALALLLGGLAALVGGLMTDGPFKGLLKVLSQAGIQGAVKILEFAAKTFMTNLKLVLNAPLNLLKDAAKILGKIFGKDVYKTLLAPLRGLTKLLSGTVDDLLRIVTTSFKSLFTAMGSGIKTAIVSVGKQILDILPKSLGGGLVSTILKPLSGLGSIFGAMFKGLATKLAPLLKPIPLIGGIISLGFAYTRFKKGDVVGGTIDLLSGIAGFIPGVGTAISFGLGILNAILDFKSGGSSQKASEKKSGILGGWLKGLGTLVLKGLKSLPIIGPAIKAVEEFSSGNYLKGIKQLAYIATPLEFIGALLGDKEASGITKTGASVVRGIGSILGSIVKWAGTAIYRAIKSLPIIGPAIKAVEEFVAGNFLKGLKQLAYIATPLEFIGALLGDKEASGVTKTGASVVRGIGGILKGLGEWVASTIWKVFSNIPIIGPALKGVQELFSGNFGKAFKQFLYINPGFELLGALLGDTEVGAITGTTAGAIKGIGGILKGIGEWVAEKITNIPVIGPLLKMIKNFTNSEWKEGFKNLGRAIGLGGLISFFETGPDETGGDSEKVVKNPFTALREALLEKARKWWKSAWSWVRWLARRVLPTSVIKALDQEANEQIETEFTPDKGEDNKSTLSKAFDRLKEAFKGALENVSKSIGNVVSSVKDGAKSIVATGISAAKGLTNTLKNTKDKVFEKVSSFFKGMTSSVTSGIKKWWSNSSFNPGTWSGSKNISETGDRSIDFKNQDRRDNLQTDSNTRLQNELAAAATDEERQKILQREEDNKKMLAKTAEKLGVSGTAEEIAQKRKEKRANVINSAIQKLEADKDKKGYIYNLIQPYFANKLKQDPAYKEFYNKEKIIESQNNTTSSKISVTNTTENANNTPLISLNNDKIFNKEITPQTNIANNQNLSNDIPKESQQFNLNTSLNNDTLKLIATNTDNTNTNIKALSETLIRLVTVLDKKMTGNTSGSTIVNLQGNSKQIPSASQVANTNYNTIGNIRQQFRQMQFA